MQREVEIHISHTSAGGKTMLWLLRTMCSMLAPNAVKPIIKGKWIYNQLTYTPSCLFSRRARISEPSTLSK